MAIEDRIQSRVDEFVKDLSTLVRQAAVEAVAAALGGERSNASARAVRGAPGRKAAPGKPATATKRKPGGKRDPHLIEQLTERLYQHISAHPGEGIESIGKSLGASTADLALPAKKLLGGKRVRTTGHRRATRYFPAGGGAGKKPTKAPPASE